MSDKVFLDTNVIVYAHSDYDTAKQTIAQTLIIDHQTTISTQIIQEAANTLNRKLKNTWPEIKFALLNVIDNNEIHTNSTNTILKACEITERYRFSFYDSLVIAAAIDSGCSVLYSEDMQHNQLIDDRLRIINPFK